MSLYDQKQWLKKQNQTLIPCPNCRFAFCMEGNEYGTARAPGGQHSPMARCPQCGIISIEGLAYDASRWWEPLRDLSRMTDDAEDAYLAEHPASGQDPTLGGKRPDLTD